MVLTAGQQAAFFEDEDQMGIPAATRVRLVEEGIVDMQSLEEFNKESLDEVVKNLRSPPGRVPNPDPGAPAGSTIPTPPFVIGARSLMRLKVATDIVRYYTNTGRVLTLQNMRWDPTMKSFDEAWKALKERKDGDAPEVGGVGTS